MTLLEMKHKYAYTLAKVGINVQPGQTVLVEAALEGYEFVPIFAEECYKLGAGNVIVNYLDQATMKVRASYVSTDAMASVDQADYNFYNSYLDSGACFVRLESVNPRLMESMPEDRASAVFNHIDGIRNIMRAAFRKYHCQWLIAMIPTQAWADYILPEEEDNLNKLWDLVFRLSYVTEDNDVEQTWKDASALRAARGNRIDALQLKKLHYTASNGTDLYVELTPYSKFGRGEQKLPADFISFQPNIPSEEICTTPEKFGTEGVVYASRPLVLGGKKIENFGFRFEKGKVVEVLAKEGKEMLENLIATDENCGYLGECALVEYHSPISLSGLVYFTTLIDENASCHLALGRGLSQHTPEGSPYTFNDATIHVDFMMGTPDMDITGIDAEGKEYPIFRNGDFAI